MFESRKLKGNLKNFLKELERHWREMSLEYGRKTMVENTSQSRGEKGGEKNYKRGIGKQLRVIFLNEQCLNPKK